MHLTDEMKGVVDLLNFKARQVKEAHHVRISKSMDVADVVALPGVNWYWSIGLQDLIQCPRLSFEWNEEVKYAIPAKHPLTLFNELLGVGNMFQQIEKQHGVKRIISIRDRFGVESLIGRAAPELFRFRDRPCAEIACDDLPLRPAARHSASIPTGSGARHQDPLRPLSERHKSPLEPQPRQTAIVDIDLVTPLNLHRVVEIIAFPVDCLTAHAFTVVQRAGRLANGRANRPSNRVRCPLLRCHRCSRSRL